ncbi:MAG TPA: hypothetical protein VGE38_08270 [Nocardioides sp.]|uniref:hypothetical protein n=1 Tax=Nocardioides sp. TaxID=35761 RepID=UPI002EDA4402
MSAPLRLSATDLKNLAAGLELLSVAPYGNADISIIRLTRDLGTGTQRMVLAEWEPGVIDFTTDLAETLASKAATAGLPLTGTIPDDLPRVISYRTAELLPVLAADGWGVER